MFITVNKTNEGKHREEKTVMAAIKRHAPNCTGLHGGIEPILSTEEETCVTEMGTLYANCTYGCMPIPKQSMTSGYGVIVNIYFLTSS